MSANESRRRAGARFCVNGMREMEKRTKTAGDRTAEEFNARIVAETKLLASTVGPMPPEAEGALLAMAEYILAHFEGAEFDVHHFTPLASMTERGLTKDTLALQANWGGCSALRNDNPCLAGERSSAIPITA